MAGLIIFCDTSSAVHSPCHQQLFLCDMSLCISGHQINDIYRSQEATRIFQLSSHQSRPAKSHGIFVSLQKWSMILNRLHNLTEFREFD